MTPFNPRSDQKRARTPQNALREQAPYRILLQKPEQLGLQPLKTGMAQGKSRRYKAAVDAAYANPGKLVLLDRLFETPATAYAILRDREYAEPRLAPPVPSRGAFGTSREDDRDPYDHKPYEPQYLRLCAGVREAGPGPDIYPRFEEGTEEEIRIKAIERGDSIFVPPDAALYRVYLWTERA